MALFGRLIFLVTVSWTHAGSSENKTIARLMQSKGFALTGGGVVGAKIHRRVAARLRAEGGECARLVQGYPFHIPIENVDDEIPYASYVNYLMSEQSHHKPVVWMVQGGSGIGNGLWGFVQAFAMSLVAGRPLLVAGGPSLPSTFLCDAMECSFPIVDLSRAEKTPGVMLSHGYQATCCNSLDPCLLRVTRCDAESEVEDSNPGRRDGSRCFAEFALRSFLTGDMVPSYISRLGPLLDRFVGDRRRLESLLLSSDRHRRMLRGRRKNIKRRLEDRHRSFHFDRVLHVRTINPANEAADILHDTEIQTRIAFHKNHLATALGETGLCSFSKPLRLSVPRSEDEKERGPRRGSGRDSGTEAQVAPAFGLLKKPSIGMHLKDLLHASKSATSTNNAKGATKSKITTVFLASDSQEAKIILQRMHATNQDNRRGAPEPNGLQIEYFNVSNAHISALSRLADTTVPRKSTSTSSDKKNEFELSKLMTFTEFFILSRAVQAMTVRLRIEVTAPLDLSQRRRVWSYMGGVSTFAETAALLGGEELHICTDRGWGLKQGAVRDSGSRSRVIAKRRKKNAMKMNVGDAYVDAEDDEERAHERQLIDSAEAPTTVAVLAFKANSRKFADDIAQRVRNILTSAVSAFGAEARVLLYDFSVPISSSICHVTDLLLSASIKGIECVNSSRVFKDLSSSLGEVWNECEDNSAHVMQPLVLQHALETAGGANSRSRERMRNGDLLVYLGTIYEEHKINYSSDSMTMSDKTVEAFHLAALQADGVVATNDHSCTIIAPDQIKAWADSHPVALSYLADELQAVYLDDKSVPSGPQKAFWWPLATKAVQFPPPLNSAKRRNQELASFLEMKRPGPSPLTLPPPLLPGVSGARIAFSNASAIKNPSLSLVLGLQVPLSSAKSTYRLGNIIGDKLCACSATRRSLHIVGSRAFRQTTVPWIRMNGFRLPAAKRTPCIHEENARRHDKEDKEAAFSESRDMAKKLKTAEISLTILEFARGYGCISTAQSDKYD